ncbi:MAG TPA: ABC-type transport auxiliary lipoprotein family protein [Thermoanaerobaculia bacterium]|nr:ABC-type transport auxiliary lipoprotein family protein [Thermoanaerobaculia bacterium]
MSRSGRNVAARGVIVLLLCAAAMGCGFLRRSQPRIYSLERITPAVPTAAVTGLPIGIDVVELPPGAERRELSVRKADHQLEVRSAELWSAPFEAMVLHTLAFDLAGRLPVGMTILPGQPKPATMRAIDVVVAEFEAGPESQVTLDARWVLRENGRPDVAHHERIAIPIESLESANVAAGMSNALAALADRMAAGLGAR